MLNESSLTLDPMTLPLPAESSRRPAAYGDWPAPYALHTARRIDGTLADAVVRWQADGWDVERLQGGPYPAQVTLRLRKGEEVRLASYWESGLSQGLLS